MSVVQQPDLLKDDFELTVTPYPSMKQAFVFGGALFFASLALFLFFANYASFLLLALVRPAYLLNVMLPVALLALYLYNQQKKRNEPPLSLSIPQGNNLWMLLLMVPALYVIVAILKYFLETSPFDWMGYGYSRRHPLIYCVIFIFLLPALQEYVFRGIILNGLLKRYPVNKALGAITLIAALPYIYPTSILLYLPISLFLGWLYYRSRSLIFTFISNAMLSLISLLLSMGEKDNLNILGELTRVAGFLPVIAMAVIIFGVTIIFFNKDIIDSNKQIN